LPWITWAFIIRPRASTSSPLFFPPPSCLEIWFSFLSKKGRPLRFSQHRQPRFFTQGSVFESPDLPPSTLFNQQIPNKVTRNLPSPPPLLIHSPQPLYQVTPFHLACVCLSSTCGNLSFGWVSSCLNVPPQVNPPFLWCQIPGPLSPYYLFYRAQSFFNPPPKVRLRLYGTQCPFLIGLIDGGVPPYRVFPTVLSSVCLLCRLHGLLLTPLPWD